MESGESGGTITIRVANGDSGFTFRDVMVLLRDTISLIL